MEKKVVIIVLTIVAAVTAGYLGYFFGQGQTQAGPEILKYLNSGFAKNSSVNLLGEVVSLANNTLTIKEESKTFSLEVPSDATIIKQSESLMADNPPAPEAIAFEDLKVGDFVSISFLFDNSGKIVSSSIMALAKPTSGSPLPAPAE